MARVGIRLAHEEGSAMRELGEGPTSPSFENVLVACVE